MTFDYTTINHPTPFYIVDEELLENNLRLLKEVSTASGAKILLAQKAFSMFSLYPLIGKYLHGTTASGLYEAKLGSEKMPGRENHVFSAAYRDDEFDDIVKICDHIVFNSNNQWLRFKDKAIAAKRSCGLRINPDHSTQKHAIYDPCSPGSRLGITRAAFDPSILNGIEGLHFHTLCEQNSDALAETLIAFEESFGEWISGMKWVNFGGGHHITRKGYDIELLVCEIKRFRERYGVTVYLEPGEAVALNAGFLVASVLDLTENNMNNAILDCSAVCHMPDVVEMPYRPDIIGSGMPGEKKHTYRLGGPTCLAGDIIGDYSFDRQLVIGDRLVFCDMAHYSMVKNNTFNGTPLPAILSIRGDEVKVVREFGYNDFKERLS